MAIGTKGDGPWRQETAEAYEALTSREREALEDKVWNMLYGDEEKVRPNSLVYFLSSLRLVTLGERAGQTWLPLTINRGIAAAHQANNPDAIFKLAGNETERWENFSRYVGRSALTACFDKAKKDKFLKENPDVTLNEEQKAQFEQIDERAKETLAEKAEYERQSHKFATDRTYAWYLERMHEAQRQSERGKRDSDFMEMQFTHGMKAGIHWFGENLWNRDDEQAMATSFAPTSEVDDQFNHLDMVATMKNAMTDYEPLVLGLDFTTRADGDDLSKKLGQVHSHGLNQKGKNRLKMERMARRDAHESQGTFLPDRGLHRKLPDEQLIAEIYPYPESGRRNTEEYQRAKQEVERKREQLREAILDSDYNVTDGYTEGMHIPGFSYVDAMWDRATHSEKEMPKGDVPVTPRFVVGCSKDIMRMMMLAKEPQRSDPKYQGESGAKTFQYDMETYELKTALPRLTLRWCTILECRQQAHDIQAMVQRLAEHEDEADSPIGNREEFQLAKHSIDQAVRYFDKSFDELVEQKQIQLIDPDEELSETDPVYYNNIEQVAYQLAMHDPVCAGILQESQTYYNRCYVDGKHSSFYYW